MEVHTLVYTVITQGPQACMPTRGSCFNIDFLSSNEEETTAMNSINTFLELCDLKQGGFDKLKYLIIKLLTHVKQLSDVNVTSTHTGKFLSIQTWRWGKATKQEHTSDIWQLRSTIPEVLVIVDKVLSLLRIHNNLILDLLTTWEKFRSNVTVTPKDDMSSLIDTMNRMTLVSPPIVDTQSRKSSLVGPVKLMSTLTPQKVLTVPNVMTSSTPVVVTTKPYRKKPISKILRMQVWEKHMGAAKQGLCLCCGRTHLDRDNFECGHIQSEYEGGGITMANLRPVCSTCNGGMGTINMLDFMKQKRYAVPANWDGIESKPHSASMECICNYDGIAYKIILLRTGSKVDICIQTSKGKRKLNVDFDLIVLPTLIRSYIDTDIGYLTKSNIQYTNQVTITFSQTISLYDGTLNYTNDSHTNTISKYHGQFLKCTDFEDIYIEFRDSLVRF
jgi:hypothetical protein